MFKDLTRREFIKSAAVGLVSVNAIGLLSSEKIFAADNCTVKTRYGTFNGFVSNGVKTWPGIPFAQPPVGKLRWRAPEPLKPINKTFDTKKFGFKQSSINQFSSACFCRKLLRRDSTKIPFVR